MERLSDTDTDKHVMLWDSQDIAEVLESIGRTDLIREVTALAVKVGDGEYTEVLATESARPYLLNAFYTRLL